jgi:hypothetical protein
MVTLPNTKARQEAQRKYNAKPEQKKKRASRNAARRKMIKAGKARKGDGKDVGHANGNPYNNNASNLRMESKKANRSFPRTKSAGKKNPKD